MDKKQGFYIFLIVCCLLVTSFFIIFIIDIIVNYNYQEYDENVKCSIWENGVNYWEEEFNCYCPYYDSAVYVNLIDIQNCNWNYIQDKIDYANYYNENG